MDQSCYIPYGTFSKMFQGNYADPTIVVKGLENDPGLQQLEGEITGLMRSRRSIKPLEDSSFSLNRPEMAANAITSIFDVLGVASWVIGGFSLLVGGFGIANIMFVSVKERTNIIGIQKSLGAKNTFILLQFLFEAIFLSLIGGGVGILLVFILTQVVPMGSLEVAISIKRIVMGFSIASIIGVLSGIIPAAMASRLDPVIAIRST
jgi:putative ABC transport system permease protein